MASNAPRSDDWRWARDLRREDVGFAPYNVMAVFPALPAAEEAVDRLLQVGLVPGQVSVRTRTLTDDPPGAAAAVEPPLDVPSSRRDEEVAGHVARNLVVLAVVCAVAGAIIGLIIGLLAGFSSVVMATTIVVAAVAGAVVGAVWGGEIGSMGEARKEEGVVVGAHLDDRRTAVSAEAVLGGLRPLRIDLHDGQGRPIRQL
jgi:hypothetical protein